jgi:transcriptional regulator with XRE-family HTH domain
MLGPMERMPQPHDRRARPPAGPRLRATDHVLRGRERAGEIAARAGVSLREARVRAGMTQAEGAARARISQPRWSELERGRGARATVETWARAAAAVGRRLATFIEQESGASLPRDIEHLRRQNEIVRRAAGGAWVGAPEMPLSTDASGRVVDVLLTRADQREACIVEVWDLLADVGAALRSFDAKTAAVGASLPSWHVEGAWVVRGTRRNRRLIRELDALVRARFPSDSRAWLASIDSASRPLPRGAALAWSGVASPTLHAWSRPRGSQANEAAR